MVNATTKLKDSCSLGRREGGGEDTTNLDNIVNRDVTLPAKVHIVKAIFFQVVMYGCEIWTIKKAEC